MTVPAREVKVGWRVNPGTPHEWVVVTVDAVNGMATFYDRDDYSTLSRYLRLHSDDPIDAVPPPRTITVPAMDDEALAWARKIADPTNPGCREVWPFVMWLADAIAAHEREAT